MENPELSMHDELYESLLIADEALTKAERYINKHDSPKEYVCEPFNCYEFNRMIENIVQSRHKVNRCCEELYCLRAYIELIKEGDDNGES